MKVSSLRFKIIFIRGKTFKLMWCWYDDVKEKYSFAEKYLSKFGKLLRK